MNWFWINLCESAQRMQRSLWGRGRARFWRFLGMQVGDGTWFSRTVITQPSALCLGRNCTLEDDLIFKCSGPVTSEPVITIGDRVFIGRGTEFNIFTGLEIGNDTMIGSGCRFVDHNHGFTHRKQPMGQQPIISEKMILKSDVWLGSGVTILKGVVIGEGAIVAAGAVVNRSIGAYEIWGGIPAKKIAERPA